MEIIKSLTTKQPEINWHARKKLNPNSLKLALTADVFTFLRESQNTSEATTKPSKRGDSKDATIAEILRNNTPETLDEIAKRKSKKKHKDKNT